MSVRALLVCFGLLFVLTPSIGQAQDPIIIVLDAGHGGGDPGNLHHQKGMLDESHLNLAIALKVEAYLNQFTQNVKVLQTRSTDKAVSLTDRAVFANENKANYFISIHCNSYTNSAVKGTETHIHDNSTATSRALAAAIEADFTGRAKRKSRGVKTNLDREQNLQVLWQTKMPSVLVECGYLSNAEEETYLNSTRGQDLTASAIFRAVRDFVNQKHPHTIKPKEAVAAANSTAEKEAPVTFKANETVYRIQILASPTAVGKDAIEFKRVKGYDVKEVIDESRAFKYRYFVGRETDKKTARKLAREIKKLGIKDAFVVEFSS